MTLSFKASMVGPSRVGKTTLLTAILAETETMLSGSGIALALDESTEMRIRRNRRDLRRAIEAREFDAASLGGSQSMFVYEVELKAAGDTLPGIPFSLLDYPGAWLDPAERAVRPEAKEKWPECEAHIAESLMLLVPVEAAVLMEAVTPAQRGAVADLLGFEDVEAMARKWARARNLPEHRDEPAVLVLAPLKCEKYFDDNGGKGREAARLRNLVREKYRSMIEVVQEETPDRTVRVVYAPVDTYGCVDLMEGEWITTVDDEGGPALDFQGHYRFRELPPRIRVKAAGTVMRELCRCVVSGQDRAEQQRAADARTTYNEALERKAERKGFWGAVEFYLSGESRANRNTLLASRRSAADAEARAKRLAEALRRIAATPADPRVEEW
ncbi:hypothetical protein GTY66_13285 [Streptomyces sp. SID8356]|uniref:hypothetical protein n=1 Tax=unclassified Streptomyces TaxID=2593676 RepID=UPI0003A09762|nr:MULTISPECIES: hypothetical protein [unclassified Streptomyces]MYT37017.1 hypothetical protein [Streptomyces sp. SID8356]